MSGMLDIPAYLLLTPEERKAAWEARRKALTPPMKLTLPPLPTPKRIASPPGVTDDRTDPDT